MVDDLDIKILNVLQDKAKTSRSQLADLIGMSIPSVSERLHKLEDKGVVEGYYAKINRNLFNYDIMAFIFVFSESSKNYPSFVEKAKLNPLILECHSILGEGSHILKAIVKNTSALENLLAELQSYPGVLSTRTSFVLSTVKETTRILL